MTRSYEETISRLEEKGLLNFPKYTSRGLEKESLRVNKEGTISTINHPAKLGSALTNQYITTDFSEALLELITPEKPSIEEALKFLDEVCSFVDKHSDDVIWPSSIPCVIEDESSIRLADYGASNSGKLKTLYRSGLSERYGSMMQCVSGIHYNFSFNENFFDILRGEENLQDFKNDTYLSLIRNFRRNAWIVLYLFGSSPVVPKTFIAGRKNFLNELNKEDLFLEYATCLRMSELGYMSEAQDKLYITYNSIEEYLADLKKALTTIHPRYEQVGIRRENKLIQINTSIIQIENEYYSSIRPKRVTPSGTRPINILREKGIEYVEIRALDNNSFLPSGIDENTSYFLEALLITCLIEDNTPSTKVEIKELLDNWQNVVRNGRNPNLKLKKNGKEISLKNAGFELIEKIREVFEKLPKDLQEYKSKVFSSLEVQLEKLKDPFLTPSGKVIEELSKGPTTWQELNFNLAKKHATYFEEKNIDLSHLDDEAKSSIERYKSLEESDDASFENFLEEYLKDI